MMDWHSSRVGGRDPSTTTGGAPSTRDNLAPDRSALVRENNHINFNLLAASNASHLFCCSIIFCSTTLMRRVFLLFSSARAFLRSCTSSSNRNARSSSDGRIRMSELHTHTHTSLCSSKMPHHLVFLGQCPHSTGPSASSCCSGSLQQTCLNRTSATDTC